MARTRRILHQHLQVATSSLALTHSETAPHLPCTHRLLASVDADHSRGFTLIIPKRIFREQIVLLFSIIHPSPSPCSFLSSQLAYFSRVMYVYRSVLYALSCPFVPASESQCFMPI